MNGTTRTSTVQMSLNVPNNAWEIVGSEDFNNDGIADLVWRNHETTGPEAGLVSIWTMDINNNATGTVQMPVQVANPNWRIEGVGDFNADGKPDLVWRNYETTGIEAGLVNIWTMNGVTPTGTVSMPLRVTNPNWRIDGVGDFNQDGQADLVWRNYETTGIEAGLVNIWTMNGVTPTGTVQMPLQVINPNWRIDGVGDFNQDGQADLVWRNYGTTGTEAGLVNIWTMNGVTPTGTVQVSPLVTDPNWRIQGTRPRYELGSSIDIDRNSLATAFNIGTLNGSGQYRNSVSGTDTNDYYRFSISVPTSLNLLLTGLSGDANVELLNSTGGVIRSSVTSGSSSESFNADLSAGTYYIRVYAGTTAAANYTLSLAVPRLLKDIYPGTEGSDPANIVAIGSTLYFKAYDPTNGYELWKSDGTSAGTVLVKDINPGTTGSNPAYLTVAGTTLYFVADNGVNGYELWKSDGTSAGTVLVKDINPGSTTSATSYLTALGNTLFFMAYDPTNGYELWKSNGTGAGTVLVKDINPGSVGSFPSYLAAAGSVLYFTAYDSSTNGYELWKSDGTSAGTVLVKDINPSSSSSLPDDFTVIGNTIYFSAESSTNGRELWKSDGTAVGTVLVKDINAGSNSSNPTNFTAIGSVLYFTADDGTNGIELWRSDGTATGTVLVRDINVGSGSQGKRIKIGGQTMPRLEIGVG